MWPGERDAVIRLRNATGASIQYCHMAWVLYENDMDEALEQIRVKLARERTRAPYKPRRTPSHYETLCQQWRDRFGSDWPSRPKKEMRNACSRRTKGA